MFRQLLLCVQENLELPRHQSRVPALAFDITDFVHILMFVEKVYFSLRL